MKYPRLFIPIIISLIISGCTIDQPDYMFCSDSKLVIRASLAGKSKMSLADESFGNVDWTSGDEISVFNSSTTSDGGSKFITSQSGSTADFEGTISDAGALFGLYPYDSSSYLSSNTIYTVVPDFQESSKGDFDHSAIISAGYVSNSSEVIGFYHVTGGIRFSVSDPDITEVEFSGNNNETLSGPVSISFSSGIPLIHSQTSKSASIRLKLTSGQGNYYYLSMIPQVLSKGFTLKFFKPGSDQPVSQTQTDSYVVIKPANFSTIRSADLQSSIDLIRDGVDLSLSGSSNCYIVSEAGNYKFPTFKGNSDQNVGEVSSASVIWETDNTATEVTVGSIISPKVLTNGHYIFFSTPDDLHDGNAVIAAKDANGKILWSWHIWVCSDYDPEAQSQYYNGKTVMDRNLGALSSSKYSALSNGLFYQWGRKDPFPGSATQSSSNTIMATTSKIKTVSTSKSEGTVAYSISNPDTYITCSESVQYCQDWIYDARDNSLWKDSKTVYDPCPAGWRVCASGTEGPWSGFSRDYACSIGAKGLVYPLAGASEAWYPANGCLSWNGSLIMSNEIAYYWSTRTDSQYATVLQIMFPANSLPSIVPNKTGKIRCEGHSVRCCK